MQFWNWCGLHATYIWITSNYPSLKLMIGIVKGRKLVLFDYGLNKLQNNCISLKIGDFGWWQILKGH
jgi:hypothetical protein